MKKIISIMAILCVALLMGACGKTALTQVDLDAGKEQAKAIKACYDSRTLDITGVPKEAIGYVVMSNQFSTALLSVTGNDPCRQTNMFDVQIAEVESKNKALSSGLGVVGQVGMFYIGADVIKAGFSAAGDTITASDNASASSTKTNTSIDDSYNTSHEDSYNTAHEDSYNTPSSADSYNTTTTTP